MLRGQRHQGAPWPALPRHRPAGPNRRSKLCSMSLGVPADFGKHLVQRVEILVEGAVRRGRHGSRRRSRGGVPCALAVNVRGCRDRRACGTPPLGAPRGGGDLLGCSPPVDPVDWARVHRNRGCSADVAEQYQVRILLAYARPYSSLERAVLSAVWRSHRQVAPKALQGVR